MSRKRKQKSKLTVWQFHTRYNRIGLCAIYLAMLLMLCGDVELNPGPVKFPCGVCNKAVRNGVRAVCCDMCDKWFHIKCTSMSNVVYKVLKNSSKSWICCQCGFPNFDSGLFESFEITKQTPQIVLNY